MKTRFGPAGHSDSYGGKTADAAQWLFERGLDAFEVQCGHGVRIGEKSAREIGKAMDSRDVALSIHAPYYINLANHENMEKNIEYIRQSCLLAQQMGAKRVILHPGALTGMSRTEALAIACQSMESILQAASKEKWNDICLCLETMGKVNQLGDLDEVLTLCRLDSSLLPCIDFGHLYARSFGSVNGYDAFSRVLESIIQALGLERARIMHIHFSKIEYTGSGEKKHRTFSDNGGFGPNWEPLAELLATGGFTPIVICESRGTQAEDAQAMKAYFYCTGVVKNGGKSYKASKKDETGWA